MNEPNTSENVVEQQQEEEDKKEEIQTVAEEKSVEDKEEEVEAVEGGEKSSEAAEECKEDPATTEKSNAEEGVYMYVCVLQCTYICDRVVYVTVLRKPNFFCRYFYVLNCDTVPYAS